jgi:hypothetical protein
MGNTVRAQAQILIRPLKPSIHAREARHQIGDFDCTFGTSKVHPRLTGTKRVCRKRDLLNWPRNLLAITKRQPRTNSGRKNDCEEEDAIIAQLLGLPVVEVFEGVNLGRALGRFSSEFELKLRGI